MQKQPSLIQVAHSVLQHFSSEGVKNKFAEPVFIVGSPRSGSTLLFEQLCKYPHIWSIGGESHAIFRAFPHLRAENSQLDSGCLTEKHADQQTADLLRASFLYLARNNLGQQFLDPNLTDKPAKMVLLEKTPRNALNIPFLLKVFPNAKFIYLHREPKENIASIMEAWNLGLSTGRFITFPDLPNWDRKAWCLLLPPGWQDYIGKSLAEIATFQWVKSNQMILQTLNKLEHSKWTSVSYQSLVDEPTEVLCRLLKFSGSSFNQIESIDKLALSKTTVTAPHPDKWKKYEQEIMALSSEVGPVAEVIKQLDIA